MEGTTVAAGEDGAAAHAADVARNAKPSEELLTFEALNRRLSSMPDYDTPSPQSRRWSRIGMVIALLAYLAALIVPRLPIKSTHPWRLFAESGSHRSYRCW